MASAAAFDGPFSLPTVDDPPLTEVGVILMGLDAERLLAGLGLAALADSPAQVMLEVDHARHEALHLTMDALVEAGVRTWSSARAIAAAANRGVSVSGSLRQSWERTLRAIAAMETGPHGPAVRAYLTACWLRRTEIDERINSLPG